MNSYQGKPGIIIGCTAAALGAMIQPVWAAETEVTNVQLNPTSKGFELVLGTQGDNRPPILRSIEAIHPFQTSAILS